MENSPEQIISNIEQSLFEEIHKDIHAPYEDSGSTSNKEYRKTLYSKCIELSNNYMKIGNTEKAIFYIEYAFYVKLPQILFKHPNMIINPSQTDPILKLGEIYSKSGMIEKEIELYENFYFSVRRWMLHKINYSLDFLTVPYSLINAYKNSNEIQKLIGFIEDITNISFLNYYENPMDHLGNISPPSERFVRFFNIFSELYEKYYQQENGRKLSIFNYKELFKIPEMKLYIYHEEDEDTGAFRFGYKDINNNVVIPAKYKKASYFSEGLAKVTNSSNEYKWGFINENGNNVIPMDYYDVGDFHDGLAWVCKSKDNNGYGHGSMGYKYGYINKNNDLIIPVKFDDAWSFNNGRAVVYYEGKLCKIDKNGKYVEDF